MENNANVAEQVTSAKVRTAEFVKSRMFDVIAVIIVISMLALSLGALELREISWNEIANILLETLPFYFATILLNNNYYMKGTYAGKLTKAFKAIVTQYSNKVNHLTGLQIRALPDFCDEYNHSTLRKIQSGILRNEALTYEEFDESYVDSAGDHGPLRALSKSELIHLLGDERASAVMAAKKVKIKGINANALLGSSFTIDATDLGPNERELASKRQRRSAVSSFVAIFILMLIGVRDVTTWGWVGAVLITFKLLYIVARSYMKYFEGYQDITMSLANHISRKTDIIKEFESVTPPVEISDKQTEGNNQ